MTAQRRRGSPAGLLSSTLLKPLLLSAVFLVLLFAPFYLGEYTLSLLGRVLSLAVAALGICIIWGRTGILSLGQGVFFGLGGYALAMHLKLVATPKGELPDFMLYNGLESLPFWWKPFASPVFALSMVVLIPTLVAAFIGWLMFRRRLTGVYVSIITQAVALAFVTLLIGSQGYTSGTNGITDFQSFLGISLRGSAYEHGLYWVTLALLALAFTGTTWLLSTHFGKLLTAVRDGENRVRFLGYNPASYKVAAFALGGLLGGVSGALYTLHLGNVSPAVIGVVPSIELVVWVALGGRASPTGAVAGMILGNIAKDRISSAVPDAWLYIMGSLFVLVVLVLPDGLAGLLKRLVPSSGQAQTPGLQPTVKEVSGDATRIL